MLTPDQKGPGSFNWEVLEMKQQTELWMWTFRKSSFLFKFLRNCQLLSKMCGAYSWVFAYSCPWQIIRIGCMLLISSLHYSSYPGLFESFALSCNKIFCFRPQHHCSCCAFVWDILIYPRPIPLVNFNLLKSQFSYHFLLYAFPASYRKSCIGL